MKTRLIQCLRNDDGGAAVEMGLIAPFLATLIIGVITYGVVIFQIMAVNDAAQAGAMWASINGNNIPANIEAAEAAATELGITTPAPTSLSCGCASGFSIASAACGTSCADGTTSGVYVTVTASYSTIEAISFRPTVNGKAVIRIQ